MPSTPRPLLSTLLRRLHLVMRQHLHDDVVAAGHPDLTPAHMYVFQSPGPDGARPTDLANRSNMTKQAMHHLLTGLEAAGYLTRERDPEDGRGAIIRLTESGWDVMRIMYESSVAVERQWARALSKDDVEQLRRLLRAIDEVDSREPVQSAKAMRASIDARTAPR